MQKKIQGVFISNSGTIANAVRNHAARYDMTLQIHLATMEDAIVIAKQYIDEGIEVILGGGATGTLLRSTLSHPVVTIARTDGDVLRACVKAKEKHEYIGVTSYLWAPEVMAFFSFLLGIPIYPITFKSTAELVEGISKAVQDGVTCIVGGGICKELAETYGIEGVTVVPSAQAIGRALEEACVIARTQRQEKEKAARLEHILDSSMDGIISVDNKGNIDAINNVAAQLLDVTRKSAVNMPLPKDVVPFNLELALANRSEEKGRLHKVRGQDFLVSMRPVRLDNLSDSISGAVIKLSLASDIRTLNKKIYGQSAKKYFCTRYTLEDLHGSSKLMTNVKARARLYARTDASLLIQGETGTGKEVLAQSIHTLSSRANMPFVAINCAALPETLLESELFGYDEGAFTGAKRGGKDGLFVLAQGGTLFLDEISDISPALQARLLRVLEEKEIMRVGGKQTIAIDVRIISAAYKDLRYGATDYTFRPDLYYRLAGLTLHLPPLRQRLEDIEAIAKGLLHREGLHEHMLSPHAIDLLQGYTWPGNVRELASLLQRYALLRGDTIADDALLKDLLEELSSFAVQPPICKNTESLCSVQESHIMENMNLKDAMENYEQQCITKALHESQYNKKIAAEKLGISANTLWRKLTAMEKKN